MEPSEKFYVRYLYIRAMQTQIYKPLKVSQSLNLCHSGDTDRVDDVGEYNGQIIELGIIAESERRFTLMSAPSGCVKCLVAAVLYACPCCGSFCRYSHSAGADWMPQTGSHGGRNRSGQRPRRRKYSSFTVGSGHTMNWPRFICGRCARREWSAACDCDDESHFSVAAECVGILLGIAVVSVWCDAGTTVI